MVSPDASGAGLAVRLWRKQSAPRLAPERDNETRWVWHRDSPVPVLRCVVRRCLEGWRPGTVVSGSPCCSGRGVNGDRGYVLLAASDHGDRAPGDDVVRRGGRVAGAIAGGPAGSPWPGLSCRPWRGPRLAARDDETTRRRAHRHTPYHCRPAGPGHTGAAWPDETGARGAWLMRAASARAAAVPVSRALAQRTAQKGKRVLQ